MDGPKGGEIVAAGTPEDIVKVKESYTGQYLKPVLARRVAAGSTKESRDAHQKSESEGTAKKSKRQAAE